MSSLWDRARFSLEKDFGKAPALFPFVDPDTPSTWILLSKAYFRCPGTPFSQGMLLYFRASDETGTLRCLHKHSKWL